MATKHFTNANTHMQFPKQNICLLLGIEIRESSDAIMLVVGSAQFEWQCRGGTAGIFGQQRLQIGLRCQLLLLQSLQGTGSFL